MALAVAHNWRLCFEVGQIIRSPAWQWSSTCFGQFAEQGPGGSRTHREPPGTQAPCLFFQRQAENGFWFRQNNIFHSDGAGSGFKGYIVRWGEGMELMIFWKLFNEAQGRKSCSQWIPGSPHQRLKNPQNFALLGSKETLCESYLRFCFSFLSQEFSIWNSIFQRGSLITITEAPYGFY